MAIANPTVVLASASAARARVLDDAHVPYVRHPADVDEDAIKSDWTGDGEGLARELARTKALAVSRIRPDAWVIGADQVLDLDGEILGKPGAPDRARAQLERLRGRAHMLISAVCLARGNRIVWDHADRARLHMRAFSDAFLDHYMERAGEAVSGSAGAYHLEGLGVQLFDRVEGDFFTVLGLIDLLNALRAHGALPS
ncbi:MAG: Maf-like protein [Alphaproteobacteria bacterium]|nr:Maf-like protein [Alphaproteobacteria bacterium]